MYSARSPRARRSTPVFAESIEAQGWGTDRTADNFRTASRSAGRAGCRAGSSKPFPTASGLIGPDVAGGRHTSPTKCSDISTGYPPASKKMGRRRVHFVSKLMPGFHKKPSSPGTRISVFVFVCVQVRIMRRSRKQLAAQRAPKHVFHASNGLGDSRPAHSC